MTATKDKKKVKVNKINSIYIWNSSSETTQKTTICYKWNDILYSKEIYVPIDVFLENVEYTQVEIELPFTLKELFEK